MGRHVSAARRRSLRGATATAIAGIVLLVALAGLAGYGIWTHGRAPVRVLHARPAATTPAASVPTLALTVTGPSCQVFVGVPGGDILVDRLFSRGESARFDDPRLNVLLSDAGAVRVYVNGRSRPPGPPGARVVFNAVRGG